ncbi:hypothetical protein [Acidimangrovimonas pyrenivorans]|uniref:G domain-containing protein n=1 Tax=Acidimangrovimonas pyrenivorans TaxID=2030798 RepID=A0ABV7AGG6_9RHOB
MKREGTVETVLASLEAMLAAPDLAPALRDQGARLRARLTAPVRIAVTGPAASGKSRLFNLLAGREILPERPPRADLALVHGAAAETVLTLADGGEERLPGHQFPADRLAAAGTITLTDPAPILKRISLFEPATAPSVESLRAALERAVARADILVWCSQDFGPEERLLWQHVPDALKDHGFLALTKADALHRAGALQDRLSNLAEIVAEEFHSLHPVATLQALAALGRSAGPDAAALAASGGKGLIGALLRDADQGRRADLDNALLFLRRHGALRPAPPRPGPETSGPDTGGPDTGAPKAALPDGISAVAAPAPANPDPAPAAAPEPPGAPLAALQDEMGPPELRAEAVRMLRDRAEALDALRDAADSDDHGPLLEHCAESVEALDALFGADAEAACGAYCDEIMDASEMLLLLRLENSAAAAEDAVTLLLQLRREIGQGLSAERAACPGPHRAGAAVELRRETALESPR